MNSSYIYRERELYYIAPWILNKFNTQPIHRTAFDLPEPIHCICTLSFPLRFVVGFFFWFFWSIGRARTTPPPSPPFQWKKVSDLKEILQPRGKPFKLSGKLLLVSGSVAAASTRRRRARRACGRERVGRERGDLKEANRVADEVPLQIFWPTQALGRRGPWWAGQLFSFSFSDLTSNYRNKC
jgi:hypothetical protein